MSFDVILPFLRPIENLILDREISEIMVNGTGKIFIERSGLLEHVVGVAVEENTLRIAVKNIARLLGDDISDEQPLLDSRLPDGSRVAAVLPPCSVGGTTLTIRKFATKLYTAQELVRIGSMAVTALTRS
jgi:pilus assembly protein CpaF